MVACPAGFLWTNLLRDFAKGGGGVVTILHDLNLTALYVDSKKLLKQGRLAVHGRVAEVFKNSVYQTFMAVSCKLILPLKRWFLSVATCDA